VEAEAAQDWGRAAQAADWEPLVVEVAPWFLLLRRSLGRERVGTVAEIVWVRWEAEEMWRLPLPETVGPVVVAAVRGQVLEVLEEG
jgi:hypothetical protein